VAHQRHGEVNNAAGQAARVHHLACEHEERHGQQRKAVSAVDDVLRQDLRVEHVQRLFLGLPDADQLGLGELVVDQAPQVVEQNDRA